MSLGSTAFGVESRFSIRVLLCLRYVRAFVSFLFMARPPTKPWWLAGRGSSRDCCFTKPISAVLLPRFRHSGLFEHKQSTLQSESHQDLLFISTAQYASFLCHHCQT